MLLSYGISVKKKAQTLVITSKFDEEGKQNPTTEEVSIKRLTGVVATLSTYFTNHALALLLSNSIPVVLMDFNRIAGVIHPYYSHGTVITRREQFMAFEDERGIELAKAFVQGPLETKANLLLSYAKNRKDTDPVLVNSLQERAERIRELANEIPNIPGELPMIRNQLMGIEGNGTNIYYEGIVDLLPKEFSFAGRTKRPPQDPINSALSYGYVILDGRCLMQIAAAGLDPYGGYLHVDRSGRPSLALDVSEEFRQPIVDRAVFDLAIKREWNLETDFEEHDDKIWLAKPGKKKLMMKITDRFNTRLIYDSQRYQLEQIILLQARKVIHYLLQKTKMYDYFKYGW